MNPRLTPLAVFDAHRDAVAEAKDRWLRACVDGSSPAGVQELYADYRDLVIAQVARVAAERPPRSA